MQSWRRGEVSSATTMCQERRRQSVLRLRRRLLKNNVEYSKRSRDPPPSENDGLAPGTDGIDGGDASLSPTGFKAMKRKSYSSCVNSKNLKQTGNNKKKFHLLNRSKKD